MPTIKEMEMAVQRRKRGGTTTVGSSPTLAAPQTPARDAASPKPSAKLYSIFALARDAGFRGQFNARGADYAFTFSPTQATLADNKLVLQGPLEVRPTRGRRGRPLTTQARAVLIATQGGIAGAPDRRQLQSGTSGTVNVATPDQKQEQSKAPETQSQVRDQAQEAAQATKSDTSQLPIVDATGPLGFVAAMFFRFQGLDGRALGVPIEMPNLQLNVRLAPENEMERDLVWLYSDIAAAAYTDKPNAADAAKYVQELNAKLKA